MIITDEIITHLNSLVSGFASGTGILRTFVPGGRKLRRAMCTEKLPSSQSCKVEEVLFSKYICQRLLKTNYK